MKYQLTNYLCSFSRFKYIIVNFFRIVTDVLCCFTFLSSVSSTRILLMHLRKYGKCCNAKKKWDINYTSLQTSRVKRKPIHFLNFSTQPWNLIDNLIKTKNLNREQTFTKIFNLTLCVPWANDINHLNLIKK